MTAEADVAEPRREHGEHVRLLTEHYDRMAQRYATCPIRREP